MESPTKADPVPPLDGAGLMPMSIDTVDPDAEVPPCDMPVPSSPSPTHPRNLCMSNIAAPLAGTMRNRIPWLLIRNALVLLPLRKRKECRGTLYRRLSRAIEILWKFTLFGGIRP